MQILTFIGITLTLLSPIFFWVYIFRSFPNLGIWRKQFFIGIGAWALSTLPLIYTNFWLVWNLVENIFFSFSYISQSILGVEVFLRIFLFFLIIFILGLIIIYVKKWNIWMIFLRACIWYSALIAGFSFFIYIVYSILWSSTAGVSISPWDYVFQGFALIFWYYIIISLLEEGLKYFWNTQVLFWEKNNYYKIIWYACTVWLGFAFFENILYSYEYYQRSRSFEGILQLVFFRSIFTVSLHILCAILLAAGLYIFSSAQHSQQRIYLALFGLWGWAIISHAFFDIALSYGYMGVIFLYIFALYITVVYITGE
jgi:hypothetical protein